MFISEDEKRYLMYRVAELSKNVCGIKIGVEILEKNSDRQYVKNEELRKQLYDLQKDVSALKSQPETVDCETCGCMIKKELAVRGKDFIKEKEMGHNTTRWVTFTLVGGISIADYNPPTYIHTPYYCKRCAPKDNKKK